MRQKWQKSHSSIGHKYSQWLDGYFIFDDIMTHMPTTAEAVGRPTKRFSESSDVTKRRRIHTLLEKSAEKRTAVKKRNQSKKSPIKLTSDEALASFVQKKLTKNQYVAIHTETKTYNADIYPTYAELLLAKKRCYPENITVTKVSGEIVLQRVCASSGNSVNVRAIYKWGCDGAAGQQNYKQRFIDSDHNHDDSFMFVVSCVPIRLVDENDTILYFGKTTDLLPQNFADS
ncbi:hypothetical protein ILUMI_07882 [Ignelater luminosus]|uniref:Uncharacterized protein n=1 Tax=Ignelater luminosus TaxID=2038154 RepID=A0A8K0D7Y0_IGNLU|nr:hypothetical protein ILUMI_07882 [Ignelater luminosus]